MKKGINMNVGLPGTGIGGIFYMITVVYIFLHEIILALQGKSSLKRWQVVAEQMFLLILMVGMILLVNYFFSKYVFKKMLIQLPDAHSIFAQFAFAIQTHPIAVPLFLLLLVLILVQTAEIIL